MASIWDSPGFTTQPAQLRQASTASSPWFNGGNYGQSQDWYSTPISSTIREQNPRVAFNAWGDRMGIADNDNTFNRWFQSQQQRFGNARDVATLYNPLMTMDQFMNTLPNAQQLRSEFDRLSPNARGAQYGRYSPNARWLPR